jgi:hypothetical protein
MRKPLNPRYPDECGEPYEGFVCAMKFAHEGKHGISVRFAGPGPHVLEVVEPPICQKCGWQGEEWTTYGCAVCGEAHERHQ